MERSTSYEPDRAATRVIIRSNDLALRAFPYVSSSSQVHPHVIVEDVESGDVHGDLGRTVFMGPESTLFLTVVLMEHDSGDPQEVKTEVQTGVATALTGAIASVPMSLLSGPELARVVLSMPAAVGAWLSTADDVIGVASLRINPNELREMVNRGPSTEKGTTHHFFTEHRGHGGVYRVYFDIIET